MYPALKLDTYYQYWCAVITITIISATGAGAVINIPMAIVGAGNIAGAAPAL